MASHLIRADGLPAPAIDRAGIESLLERGELFWLDLHAPDPSELELLRQAFGFHPLAVEDSEQFGQRAKLEEYDDFVFLVVYGWAPDADGLVEVHCFYSERFLVTVHRDHAPALEDLREHYARNREGIPDAALLLYRVVDGLVDSFFPALEGLDDRLDAVEDEMLLDPSHRQLQAILEMRRRLVTLRKAVAPERDLLGRVLAGSASLPGMTREAEHHFRDVYDHLIRLAETMDTHRDLLTASMEVYASTVSNRLNLVMKQLTLIATIFLPLSFITGFFGQNFGFMVEHVDAWPAFVGLGVGLEIVALGLLVVLGRRRGWFR